MKITKENYIPLYLQVITKIMNEIDSNRWSEGTKLPSEKDLCEMFGVSLITIRSALKELNNQGVIYKVQGKGSYVSNNYKSKHNLKIYKLKSFTEEMANNNKTAGALVVSQVIETATEDDVLLFGIDIKSKINVIKRVRTVNGYPTHVSTHRIPVYIIEKLKNVEFTGSLFKMFETSGFNISKGTEEIEAIMPSKDEAKLLRIDTNQPVIQSISITASNEANIMKTTSVINSNKIKIKLDLAP